MTKSKERTAIQEKLSEKLLSVFDLVIEERQNHYQNNKKPVAADVEKLISSASKQNALISGAASLIPGPLGMLAAVPEIGLVVRNQLKLVYDIGLAYGQEKYLNRELLAATVLSALGAGRIGLLSKQGGKYLLKQTSAQTFENLVKLLGGRISEQLLKSVVAKWIPFAGSAAMASWSNFTTGFIGKSAAEIFKNPIENDNEKFDERQIETQAEPKKSKSFDFNELKVYSLINLMIVDKKATKEEKAFIRQIIKNSEFKNSTQERLLKSIDNEIKQPVDYQLFKNSPDDSIGLMVDLIALAKREGEFHISEKMYIKQVGVQLGFSEGDVQELMEQ